jgi:dUTP pyrophosphatase
LKPEFSYQLLRVEAVAPFKARVSDSGYDLTVIRRVKQHGTVTLFGTGLSVRPPYGWYFDVVPRSSIIKSGYLSANSVGVIDRSYRGEIMVPLLKIDPDAPDLELPARVAQMIPRPIVHLSPIARETLNSTQRGTGGFGSTGT